MSPRFYAILLRLYPADFRDRYGRAMQDFHRDRLREARNSGDSLVLVWARIAADIVLSAGRERLRVLAQRPTPSIDAGPVPALPYAEAPRMETLTQDLRLTVRSLIRRPAFTAVVLATIALGIGANAAIFSVVSGILLRPLPYPHAERLFSFGHEPPTWLTSDPDFVDYRRDMRSLDGLAAYTRGEATVTGAADPERVRIVRATEDFFPVLGVRPLLGRAFGADEYQGNPPTVVIISHGFWQRRFGADPSTVGQKIVINGVPRTIVAVMPPRFDYPSKSTDVWAPLPRFKPDSLGDRANHYLFMVGRLKPDVPLERAKLEATTIARRIMRDYPAKFDPKSPLTPNLSAVTEDLVGKTRPYLIALFGAVGFVLLIACANVANLLLVRGEGRRKEMALRSALGASAGRLVTQLLTEAAVLSFVGAGLGLALGWAADRALVALAPASLPRIDEIGLDWRVIGFTAIAAVITAVFVGVVPAARIWRADLAGALKEGGKATGERGSARRARRSLVVAEVALAVIMLSGASMLLRSLWHLQSAGLGFDPRQVLTAKVSISRDYNDERTAAFYDGLVTRLRALPGVRAAGASGWLAVVDAGGLWGVRPEGGNYPEGRWPLAVPQQVTPGYFAAVGLPLIEGRDITLGDRMDSPNVAVISKKFAEMAWPGGSAVGKRFRLGVDSVFLTVVGIVGDIRSRGFGDTPEPTMYFPHAQSAKTAYFTPRAMAILIRANGDPLALAAAVRREVRALDKMAPVSEVRSLESVVGTSVANRKFSTALLAGFALLALVLAGIGTYGVISYSVSQRTYEIGVRMALGAERERVMALVMWEGMRMAFAGLAIGLAGSLAMARAIRAMLVGVSTFDAPTFAAVALLLGIVALAASSLPARRASGVSPVEALRGGG